MKRIFLIAVIAILMVPMFVSTSRADLYSSSLYLNSLVHGYYYWWDIDASALKTKIDSGTYIDDAYLVFKNLKDTSGERYITDLSNPLGANVLYFAFADAMPTSSVLAASGTFKIYGDGDSNSNGIDNTTNIISAPEGAQSIGWYSDPLSGTVHVGQNLKVSLASFSALDTFKSYVKNNGHFTIGLDPDCHWVYDELYFEVKVPEPNSLLLFGTGLAALGFFSIRRNKIG